MPVQPNIQYSSSLSIATSGGTSNVSDQTISLYIFTGTLSHTLVLTNALMLYPNYSVSFYNSSTNDITIKMFDGTTTLLTLKSSYFVTISLINNSTSNGTWQVPIDQPPIGSVFAYAGTTSPLGFLFADGSIISRTTYKNLFDILGTSFGAGDGSTTFALPDIRGKAIGGAGQGTGLTNRVFASSFGTENHTLSTTEMPSHAHSETFRYQGIGTGGSGANALVTPSSAFDGTTSITFNSTGGGGAHNNMQPTLFLNYIIKY